jgi:hypothetical protein
LSAVSATKPQAITAPTTLPDPGEPGRVRLLSDLGAEIAARQADIGPVSVPRNSGARRTASKRALLKAIEEAGGRW